MKKIKIICITGTRADYGIYYPLLAELNKDNLFDLKLIVTGMHLIDNYGKTIEEIKGDQFDIIATPAILVKGDTTYAMSQSLGLGILYFSDILNYIKPQFILLLGDRGEMLATAIAAHYQNIGIIHLHGGEISGSADDNIRHAISKLAHLHFVSTVSSKQNLILMGEEEWRIITIGSLRKKEINKVKNLSLSEKEQIISKYSLNIEKKNILVIMHPNSKDTVEFSKQIEPVLTALSNLNNTNIIFIGPNSDAGGDLFREKIHDFIANKQNTHYYSTIKSQEYLCLLQFVNLLVGNSSSGIIESPFFDLPVINIGKRQQFREQADNVINVDYDQKEILKNIEYLLTSKKEKVTNNPYDLEEYPEKVFTEKLKSFINIPNLLQKKYFHL